MMVTIKHCMKLSISEDIRARAYAPQGKLNNGMPYAIYQRGDDPSLFQNQQHMVDILEPQELEVKQGAREVSAPAVHIQVISVYGNGSFSDNFNFSMKKASRAYNFCFISKRHVVFMWQSVGQIKTRFNAQKYKKD